MTNSKTLDLSARLLPIAALAPLLLASAFLASDPSFEGKPIIHALGQLLSGVIVLFSGVMLLKNKSAIGNNALIIIGLGMLGAAVLDLCHGFLVIPSYRPDTLSEVVPWGWFPSRVFLPVLLCISLLTEWYEQRHGETGSTLLLIVCTLSGFFVAACCLFFLLLPVPLPLPQVYFPDSAVPRPAEYFPALLFLFALVGFWHKGEWRRNIFQYNLLLALFASVATHALLMPYSEHSFDSFFAAGTLSKIVSYAFLLVGLILQSREGMKQETKEQKLRHQAIVEMASDGIITMDSMGVIDSFNSSAEQLFGFSAHEVLGENFSMLLPPSYRSEHYALLSSFRETGETKILGKTRDVTGQRKNGTTFPMEFTASEIQFSDTHLFMGIARDISERKQHLEALETARQAADEANRAKSAFLANMSHEIRTPLNGVIGMTEVLQQTGLQDDQMEMAGLIRQSGASLLAIVEEILDFSKIEADMLDIDPTPISVAGVAESVCSMLINFAEKSEVELTLFTDSEIPEYLLGDGQRLRQVLTNLINNAIKFSGGLDRRGRVSVRVVLAPKHADQVMIEFRVIDNGIGMDEATQARVFTAFTQADSSTSRRFGGSGLGLAISQRLVDLMGGEITVQSAPGQGTTFSAKLPFAYLQVTAGSGEADIDLSGISRVPEDAPVAAYSREQALRQNRLILVAEDNVTNQKVILHQLSALGYTADIASNGAEALECWRGGDYAFLLTDLQMPEMDGFELATKIRAEEGEFNHKPIAALTANILVHEAEHCREVGMEGYLSKPASLADLRALLEKWLPSTEPEAEVNHTPARSAGLVESSAVPLFKAEPPVDVSVLEGLVGNESQIIGSLLEEFRVSASAIAAELSSACHAGQAKAAADAAHKLKSSALAVGALPLAELCRAIEQVGRAGHADQLADLLGQFNA